MASDPNDGAWPESLLGREEDRTARRRLAFLAEIGEALASSRDVGKTLEDIARIAVPLLGDMCIVDLVVGGELRRVATAHVDPTKQALLDEMRQTYPTSPGAPNPASRALASGRAELVSVVTEDVIASQTRDAGHADLVRRIGIHSHIAVPLVAHGLALGALSLGLTESNRSYGPDDVVFAEEVARRAALALDNARLYDALRLQEERFRAVVEQSPLSTQILAPDGYTILVNRAWERLWGITHDRILDYDMLADAQLEARGVTPFLRRAFGGEAVEIPAIRYDPNETLPERSTHRDPARWVRAFAYPVKADDGRVREVVLVHEDVSERVENEMKLREDDRRKDEFLATLAHELRNPLAPLRTGLDLLRRTSGPAAEAARAIMDRQLTHMVSLLDDLLDVSRIRSGKIELRPVPLAMDRVVDTALELSGPALEAAGLTVTVARDATAVASADPTRLAQVVSNLLNNAAKYTPAGGHVTIAARRVDGEIELSVSDDGIGIPAPMLDRVFEMFSQVRSSRSDASGLGVGLTLARRLVELHGGRIWAESEGLGRGTRVVLRLPAIAAPATPRSSPPAAAPGTAAKRVLVVDDNVDGAELLVTLLQLDGHTARQAHDGPAALRVAAELRPEVAFLDIGMPGMDGYELARRLRAMPELAGLVLVAVTGWGQEEDRRRSREAGFDHHLTKPVAVEDIRAALR